MWVWCDTERDLSGVEGMGEWVDGMDEAKGDGQCCQVRFTGKYAGPLPLDRLALSHPSSPGQDILQCAAVDQDMSTKTSM